MCCLVTSVSDRVVCACAGVVLHTLSPPRMRSLSLCLYFHLLSVPDTTLVYADWLV
eukprot:m.261400 g.261400  ORF g.261400 m.261400 type:complete len:56 (-) comp42094_c0_seq1:283-450(-)